MLYLGAITLSDTSNMYNVYNKEGNEVYIQLNNINIVFWSLLQRLNKMLSLNVAIYHITNFSIHTFFKLQVSIWYEFSTFNSEFNYFQFQIQKSSRKHLTAQNLVKVSTTDDIREATGDVITGWVSYRGYHLIPAFQSAITNLVLMMNNKTARVIVTNAPLPKAQNEDSLLILPPGDTLVFVLTNILAGAFICASFTRVCGVFVCKFGSPYS